MNAVNTVPLFILVWTFSAVCQDDDDVSVSCQNVTGSVGKEVTLTCSISLMCNDCSIEMYKFQYPKRFNDSAICKEVFTGNRCEQTKSFTCRYTPTTAITGQFRFFVQTTCGMKRAEFTVDIAESSSIKEGNPEGTMNAVIPAVVGLSVILILILILMTIICKTQCFRFQKRMFPCIKHDDGHSNCPEDVI